MLCLVESIAPLILRVTIILCTTREENLPIIIVKFIDLKCMLISQMLNWKKLHLGIDEIW